MLDLVSFIAFITVLALLIYKDRKKAKFEGILLIRRTKKGRNFIDRVEKKSPAFWNIISILGIVVTIPFMVVISAYLINSGIQILLGKSELAGAGLLLPGPISTPMILPGTFIIPWWIWVIGVFSVMVPHEFSHGIMCRLEKIKIKSVGWLLFLFIPGAFVEPDEKKLSKAKKTTKLKVYAAGSFANFLVAIATMVLLYIVIVLSFQPSGLMIYEVAPGSPANVTNLTGTILAINGIAIDDYEDIRQLPDYEPGETIELEITENNYQVPVIALGGSNIIDWIVPDVIVVNIANETKTYDITLSEHPEGGRGYIGIESMVQTYSSSIDLDLYMAVSNLMIWIYVFNLGIGLFNLLPIKPLDGGLILETLLGKRKKAKAIVKAVSIIMLLVLVFNIIGPSLV